MKKTIILSLFAFYLFNSHFAIAFQRSTISHYDLGLLEQSIIYSGFAASTDYLPLKNVAQKQRIAIDDYLQYAPVVAVYGLNAIGVRGKHRFVDRTLLVISSYILMATTVYGLKKVTRVERPDGSSFDSFPSGHTAIAFMGAEYLRREYEDVSLWIGVGGYTLAATTGYLRLHQNRHRPLEVIAGAGIGVLSTTFVYMVYPYISGKLFKGREVDDSNVLISPYFNQNGSGISMMFTF